MNFLKWKCFCYLFLPFLSNAFALYITLIKVNELKSTHLFRLFFKGILRAVSLNWVHGFNWPTAKQMTTATVAAKAATSATSTVTEPMKKWTTKNTNKQMVTPKSNDDGEILFIKQYFLSATQNRNVITTNTKTERVWAKNLGKFRKSIHTPHALRSWSFFFWITWNLRTREFAWKIYLFAKIYTIEFCVIFRNSVIYLFICFALHSDLHAK